MTMDFNERVIPSVSSNFMYKEALARYDFLSKFIKTGQKVLDLGCGTGYGTHSISLKKVHAIGIDIDPEAITFASKKYSNKFLKFKVGNVENKITVKHDIICSFEVIEHLKNPKKYLDNIYKGLKSNGYFVLSTPNSRISSPNGELQSEYHTKEYNFEELNKLLKNKFKTVTIYGQVKSPRAKAAWKEFLKSQNSREQIVKSDKFGIRKLIPKSVKEKIWKYAGNFVGRGKQEQLDVVDFPVTLKNVKMADYFIAVCQKSQ